MWHCATCEHLNTPDSKTCEKCGKEKVEKVYPLWRRALVRDDPDYRKYAEGKSKHKRREH
jgi:RNA polymerase subunit RPABC4/transcription elongation factor Spt4